MPPMSGKSSRDDDCMTTTSKLPFVGCSIRVTSGGAIGRDTITPEGSNVPGCSPGFPDAAVPAGGPDAFADSLLPEFRATPPRPPPDVPKDPPGALAFEADAE